MLCLTIAKAANNIHRSILHKQLKFSERRISKLCMLQIPLFSAELMSIVYIKDLSDVRAIDRTKVIIVSLSVIFYE